MKKNLLITLLVLLTIGLTACRNNNYPDVVARINEAGINELGELGELYDERYDEPYEVNIISDETHQRSENPEITLAQAIQIAYDDLENRGITAAFKEDSGMEWERGQWVWELLFTTQGERMPFVEYYISVEDGTVVKFEFDD